MKSSNFVFLYKPQPKAKNKALKIGFSIKSNPVQIPINVNRVFDIACSEVSISEQCGLLAYSPLAGGRLSGKYIGNKKPENARYTLWPRRFDRHHTVRGEIAIEKYFNLAKKLNIAPSTFANSFVNDRPFVTSNIIGATTMNQLKENIDSINVSLNEETLKEIENIHLNDPNPCV